jgi:hypothetical protein
VRRAAAGFVVGLAFGWHATVPTVHQELVTEVRTVPAIMPAMAGEPAPNPDVDLLIDWDEVDRQTECLWRFLQQHRIEITLANVITAGDWTDMHGGACAMMERENGE